MEHCQRCHRSLSFTRPPSALEQKKIDSIFENYSLYKGALKENAPNYDPVNSLHLLWSQLPTEYVEIFASYMPKISVFIKNKAPSSLNILSSQDLFALLESGKAASDLLLNTASTETQIKNKDNRNSAQKKESMKSPLAINTAQLQDTNTVTLSEAQTQPVKTQGQSLQRQLINKTKLFKNFHILKNNSSNLHSENILINEKNILDSFILLDKQPRHPTQLDSKLSPQAKINSQVSSNQDTSLYLKNSAKSPTKIDSTASERSSTITNYTSSSPKASADVPSDYFVNRLNQNIQTEINPTSKLFLELETNSLISHPLCTDCSHKFISLISDKLEEISEEYQQCLDLYALVLAEHNNSDKALRHNKGVVSDRNFTLPSEPDNLEDLEKEYRDLVSLEQEYDATLEDLSYQLELLSTESDDLDHKINNLLHERNDLSYKLDSLNSEVEYLQYKYNKQSSFLFDLQQVNVYNDLFTIKFYGANGIISNFSDSRSNLAIIGVINGFRLGKIDVSSLIPKSSSSSSDHINNINKGEITWSEINAAWGQCLLLLVTVAKRLNFEFENYKLIPMGSFSKIVKISSNNTDKSTLEL
ncbi:hypothetical protein BB560_003452 [Smittium megazygosporum]|uniref:Atg6 BARA domain-containing protein n=1 Tax=Smittium megazygosporum TaxID=133381 RepID=A0A2T9ZBI7_9FUNG|nr:hypothetical protein BB560_003612 [Smittium megazygosporum]PVV02103.1 hypothetical protein BB560_003452 [Smittium megazygosporum]